MICNTTNHNPERRILSPQCLGNNTERSLTRAAVSCGGSAAKVTYAATLAMNPACPASTKGEIRARAKFTGPNRPVLYKRSVSSPFVSSTKPWRRYQTLLRLLVCSCFRARGGGIRSRRRMRFWSMGMLSLALG